MEIRTVSARRRTALGSKAMRKARAAGDTPGVIYGKGGENVNLLLDSKTVVSLIHDLAHVVELDVGGEKQHALIRAIQRDYLGDQIIHIDFYRVSLDDEVRARLPITFVGTARGTAHGGLLEVLKGEVGIYCKASAIPRNIVVDVTHLDVGDSIRFKDLTLPAGAKLVPNPKGLVVACTHARRAAALTKAEELAAAAPEAAGTAGEGADGDKGSEGGGAGQKAAKK